MSLSEKILPVESFNDMWYKNCFYNALIPVVQYYLGRIDSFIISDLGIEYTYEKAAGIPSITYKPSEQVEAFEYLSRLGISSRKNDTKQIVKDIKNAIEQDKLVIVGIDCYYESTRKDTYLKNHWPHVILVNGFNEESIYVSESDYINSIIYKQSEIPQGVMEECHESYVQRFYSDLQGSFFEFSFDEKGMDKESIAERQDAIVKEAIQKRIEKRSQVEKSVEAIREFADNLKFEDSEIYYKALDSTIEKMNELINHIQVNQYLMVKLFEGKQELTEVFNEVIRLWSGIRGCMAKIRFSESCSDSMLNGVKKRLNTLYELEKKRITMMFNILCEKEEGIAIGGKN